MLDHAGWISEDGSRWKAEIRVRRASRAKLEFRFGHSLALWLWGSGSLGCLCRLCSTPKGRLCWFHGSKACIWEGQNIDFEESCVVLTHFKVLKMVDVGSCWLDVGLFQPLESDD